MMKLTKKLIPLCCAALMLLGTGICEGISTISSRDEIHQQAAERWMSDDTLAYAQISVFYSRESAPPTTSVESLRESVNKALTTASLEPKNKDAELWYDAWSTEQGTVTVNGMKPQETKAVATAVGGYFFRVHPMKLLNGSYVSQDDLMHDRVVIDDLLAWFAFGSSNVAGMELTVNGTVYQVAGVVESPQDKTGKAAYGTMPRIYLPYAPDDPESGSSTIGCYEAVLPNPVRNFGQKTMTDAIGERDFMRVLVNTRRTSISRRWNSLRHLREMVAASDGIIYPWWENAARMRDFSAAQMLRLEILLLIFPTLCLLFLIWKGYRYLERLIDEKREHFKRRYRTIEKDPYSL